MVSGTWRNLRGAMLAATLMGAAEAFTIMQSPIDVEDSDQPGPGLFGWDSLEAAAAAAEKGKASLEATVAATETRNEKPLDRQGGDWPPPLGTCAPFVSPKQQLKGRILKSICARLGHANFLVFGTGYDSPLWVKSNEGGRTFFLERHANWVHFQPGYVQNATFHVEYTTRYNETEQDLNNESKLAEFFNRQIPPKLKSEPWDQILVDSPEGGCKKRPGPGRGQSVYAASRLAGPCTIVFVDDCDRLPEIKFTKRWLAASGRELHLLDNGHGGETCMVGPADTCTGK